MTEICASIRVNEETDRSNYKCRRICVTALNERMNRNDFLRTLVDECNQRTLAPTHISFNLGTTYRKGRQHHFSLCHVLFATLEDAQAAHVEFHMQRHMFESYATSWWAGGPPLVPAKDMSEPVSGVYLAEGWRKMV